MEDEITFVVNEAPEGGYTARALGESIFTDADDLPTLHANIREAVLCHFDEGKAPRLIHLHFVRDEVIAV
ncbi:MAG: 2-oxoisovalerate dehydrogenase [bacterium]